jgi:hypothetical protein
MRDLMPPTDDLPGLDDARLVPFLGQVYRETTGLVWLGLVLGALVFVLGPVLTVYIPLPTFLLPRGLRDRHADRIFSTRFYLVRQAVFLLKMYACMCWGQDPTVRGRFNLAAYPADPGTFRTS